jgi:hypothetical protein
MRAYCGAPRRRNASAVKNYWEHETRQPSHPIVLPQQRHHLRMALLFSQRTRCPARIRENACVGAALEQVAREIERAVLRRLMKRGEAPMLARVHIRTGIQQQRDE